MHTFLVVVFICVLNAFFVAGVVVPGLPEVRLNHIQVNASFRNVWHASFQDCLVECGRRSTCTSGNYFRHVRLCQLNKGIDQNMNVVERFGAAYFKMNDKIRETVKSTVCFDVDCQAGKRCGTNKYNTPVCRLDECPEYPLVTHDLSDRGGENFIGARRQVACLDNASRRPSNRTIAVSVCQPNGTWSPLPDPCPDISVQTTTLPTTLTSAATLPMSSVPISTTTTITVPTTSTTTPVTKSTATSVTAGMISTTTSSTIVTPKTTTATHTSTSTTPPTMSTTATVTITTNPLTSPTAHATSSSISPVTDSSTTLLTPVTNATRPSTTTMSTLFSTLKASTRTTSSSPAFCMDNWINYADMCYYLHNIPDATTWRSAHEHCEMMGASLVRITDVENFMFLQDLLNTYGREGGTYWTGGKYQNEDSVGEVTNAGWFWYGNLWQETHIQYFRWRDETLYNDWSQHLGNCLVLVKVDDQGSNELDSEWFYFSVTCDDVMDRSYICQQYLQITQVERSSSSPLTTSSTASSTTTSTTSTTTKTPSTTTTPTTTTTKTPSTTPTTTTTPTMSTPPSTTSTTQSTTSTTSTSTSTTIPTISAATTKTPSTTLSTTSTTTTTTTTPQPDTFCMDNWINYADMCYYLHDVQDATTWNYAYEHCEMMGASLVRITDVENFMFLQDLLNTHIDLHGREGGTYWTGGKYRDEANGWFWYGNLWQETAIQYFRWRDKSQYIDGHKHVGNCLVLEKVGENGSDELDVDWFYHSVRCDDVIDRSYICQQYLQITQVERSSSSLLITSSTTSSSTTSTTATITKTPSTTTTTPTTTTPTPSTTSTTQSTTSTTTTTSTPPSTTSNTTTTTTAPQPDTECDVDWVLHGGVCYRAMDVGVSQWKQAREHCTSLHDAFQVMILDDDTFMFIKELLNTQSFTAPDSSYWIGGLFSVDQWVWAMAEFQAPISSFYWIDASDPEHYSARAQQNRCLYLARTEWHDWHYVSTLCDDITTRFILCQKEAKPDITVGI